MLLGASGIAASVNPSTVTPHKKTHGVMENQHARKRMHTLARSAFHIRNTPAHGLPLHVLPPRMPPPGAIAITSDSIPVRSRPILRKAM